MRKIYYNVLHILFCLLLVNIIIPQVAYAYLDPGTGSMVFQIIAATLIGISCTMKMWIHKIKTCIKREKDDNNQ